MKFRVLAAAALAASAFVAVPAANAYCWINVYMPPTDVDVPHVGRVHLDGHYICVN